MEQIDRDVMRTHPDMPFFSGDSTFAKSNQVKPLFRSVFIAARVELKYIYFTYTAYFTFRML